MSHAPAETFAEPPPPVRPADLVVVGHLGQPRATIETLDAALGVRRPVDIMLVAALGVDVAVMAAVDTSRPIDVAALSGARGGYVFAMTPPGASHARSLLSSRYRFAHVEGLGERLLLRGDPGLSAADHRLPCALVRVPSTISSRVVCGSDEATLSRAGRWVAYESVARANSRADFEAVAEGEGLGRDVAPMMRDVIARAQQRLMADASGARREHDRPPDFGDPEALIAGIGDVATELSAALGALRRVSVRAEVTRERMELTVDFVLPPTGGSSLITDVRERAEMPVEHPLAAMLPADAVFVLGDRAPSASRAETLRRLTSTALRVLGDRVSAPTAARGDLDALVAHAGDELAVAVARDAPDGVEVSLALSQTDHGTAARAVLARMVTAPWLRALRVGQAPTVTAIREGVVVSQPTSAVAGARGASLALGVRAGALVAVLGKHAANTLEGTALRAGGPVPALIAEARASVAGGVELSALGVRGAGPARFTYGARREGDGVTATLRASIPTQSITVALGLLE